ncbi:YbhB/YbcL family Raf kinase inhibitor-like protein [Microbispora sp. RL4-1S]|uniref:YbhB/YbcL family Raf kinase inhibitor-like protein n=1 Tax=Microbispora oryzae TaxID=2806554 RepID=A0A940WMU0_9ACTN|nr:YbhB/YbcL family Raf kinase inhibitor-like protein [Microbispora oryzae]MBP2706742.1 YbhB/YbcL family Raf kinase inhibitor-like protein [Microbispora oryzae]
MKIGKLGVAGGAVLLAVVLPGCSAEGASRTDDLKVSSPAFAEGAAIPKKFVCAEQGGQDVSPPLAWSGVPESARELAIVADDPDAPGGTYIHWIVTGVPVSATSVSEGRAEGKALPGSSGRAGYAGPCPPGGVHHYHFIVYALPGPITPSGDAKAVHQQIKDASISSGETVGTWGS